MGTTAPPTAERRAHVQVLRTLGLLDLHEKITPETMKAYDKVFAMPIPIDILRAIAALVDRELPQPLMCCLARCCQAKRCRSSCVLVHYVDSVHHVRKP
jgi:hypothetical protein